MIQLVIAYTHVCIEMLTCGQGTALTEVFRLLLRNNILTMVLLTVFYFINVAVIERNLFGEDKHHAMIRTIGR